jgi:hypothetical protein
MLWKTNVLNSSTFFPLEINPGVTALFFDASGVPVAISMIKYIQKNPNMMIIHPYGLMTSLI